MVLNGGKALLADDMLDPAGILGGSLSADAQGFQPLGQDPVALIDHFRDLFSSGSQGNVAVFVHADMAAVAEILHGHADAGLGNPSSLAISMERTYGLSRLRTSMVSR